MQEAGGVAEAIALQLLETDLANQLRAHLDPTEVLAPGPSAGRPWGSSVAEAVPADQRLELGQDLAPLLRREGRCVAHVVEHPVGVDEPQQQRPHPRAGG